MNIHEYQAKEILRAHGVPVPPGEVATTPAEAEAIARKYGGMVVVKAQVHAGGRGKAGGVKLASTPEEARAHAERILGMDIKGLTVEKVLVTPAKDIASEAYVGIIVDRASKSPVFMVSREGGVDIEEVAATNPEAIRKLVVDRATGSFRTRPTGSPRRYTTTPSSSVRARRSCSSSTRPSSTAARPSPRSIR